MRVIYNPSYSDSVEAFDEEVYKQERNVLRFRHINDEDVAKFVCVWTNLQGSYNEPIAKYSLDADNEAIIDMTDYIRAYPEVTTIYVECEMDRTITIPMRVVGLINPKSLIVPETPSGMHIQSPSMMLASKALGVPKYSLEFYAENFGDYKIAHGGGEPEAMKQAHVTLAVMDEVASIAIYDKDGNVLARTQERALDCERRYASVRWVSATGATRLHTFEVRDLTQSADDITRFETADGTYSVSRGRVDGFKLYLENLNAYDYWYYADVINSQSVKVSIDGNEFRAVNVLTKSVTIPNTNSGKLSNLEINVNWREYDAVTLQRCNS